MEKIISIFVSIKKIYFTINPTILIAHDKHEYFFFTYHWSNLKRLTPRKTRVAPLLTPQEARVALILEPRE
jgi:hypothetical protein